MHHILHLEDGKLGTVMFFCLWQHHSQQSSHKDCCHRSCAVNNYTTQGKKKLAMDFCAFVASREESVTRVIQNVTIAPGGLDPFRTSHFDDDAWEDQGYEAASTLEYLESIRYSLTSDNCVTDIRFPSSSEIYAVLDEGMYFDLLEPK